MSLEKQIKIRPSDFVEKFFYINNSPFTFKGREYLRKVYDSEYKIFLLKAGRQVEKSTTIAGKMLTLALLIPHFQELYVSPSSEQTRKFSSQKLAELINNSPLIQRYYIGPGVVKRVYERSFLNGSRIMLGYAFLNADRIRGASADAVFIDEIQDMITDNIPVIEETMSHSPYGYRLYAGTPKHMQSAIEFFWQRSTQTEWVIKCEHCNHWNILSEKNIQPHGLACEKCGKLLNKENGVWADMVPDAPIKSLRLPQPIMSWISWSDIWYKYQNYSREAFYNEVLALPYSTATNVLTQEDLVRASGTHPLFEKYDSKFLYNQPTYMGIDWSTSTPDSHSYTVVVIGTFINGKFHIVHMRRFMGLQSDIGLAIEEILKLAKEFKVQLIGADWGVGSGGANAILRRELGGFNKLWEFYYSFNQKELVKWDKKGLKFVINRTQTLTNLFMRIKDHSIVFPRFSDWSYLAEDFLNLYVDYNNQEVMFYNKLPDKSDDLVHAVNFCYLAALLNTGQLNVVKAKMA